MVAQQQDIFGRRCDELERSEPEEEESFLPMRMKRRENDQPDQWGTIHQNTIQTSPFLLSRYISQRKT